jgi:hypothetical protein
MRVIQCDISGLEWKKDWIVFLEEFFLRTIVSQHKSARRTSAGHVSAGQVSAVTSSHFAGGNRATILVSWVGQGEKGSCGEASGSNFGRIKLTFRENTCFDYGFYIWF